MFPEVLFPPIRQWAGPSFDLHAEIASLPTISPRLYSLPKDLVLPEIDKDRHAS